MDGRFRKNGQYAISRLYHSDDRNEKRVCGQNMVLGKVKLIP